ncbi:hypothetical protein LOD99_7301 [Oopsacas minuta]|uniref:START domain-containing protein n=1 Tax=Oopsacas minuta TaxID=111878 RepID=A0AAV7JW74_9METZ|nr:hypothetical protein LOD99_7301 [Oopsacas minuta]
MATKDSRHTASQSDAELIEILGRERKALEDISNDGNTWKLYKEGDSYVSQKSEEHSKDGTIVFKFVANYVSTKDGEIAKDKLHEIMWNSSFEDYDTDVEDKKILYTNEDKTLQVKYLREKFPWPCEKRDYITAFAREYTEGGSYIWGVPVNYAFETPKKVVRGRESFTIKIEADGDKKCKMTSVYSFNAGGWIPQWMLNMGIADMLNTMVEIQKLL